MRPERISALKDTHPELWQSLANAMLHDFAGRLGIGEDAISEVKAPLSADEVDHIITLAERLKAQMGVKNE